MADISVPVADLRVGHYIKLPLSWKQHPFLFSSFRIKDDAQLDIVRQIGLREIIVDPDKSTTEVIITPPDHGGGSRRSGGRSRARASQVTTATT